MPDLALRQLKIKLIYITAFKSSLELVDQTHLKRTVVAPQIQ